MNNLSVTRLLRFPETGSIISLVAVLAFFVLFGNARLGEFLGAASWVNFAANLGIVAIPVGIQVMSANGNYIFPAGPLTIARVIAGTGALVALTAIPVLAIGTILRRSAGAILVAVVIFVLPTFTGPGILGPTSSGGAATWLYRVTPAAGFSVLGLLPRSGLVNYPYTMANGYYPLPPSAGLLVLGAYAAAALFAARIVLRRRDA